MLPRSFLFGWHGQAQRRHASKKTWHALQTPCTVAIVVLFTGCANARVRSAASSQVQLQRRALECLKTAVGYEHNPAVRVQAVEALRYCGSEEGWPWIRSTLLDPHPSVRFAGCIAVGELRDAAGEAAARALIADEDAGVRVAALFALHRLGHCGQSGRMPGFLLDHPHSVVRRNAALVMGLLEEPSAIKILARAMKDGDAGVRFQAMESMARLGNPEAKQELTFMTGSGVGADEVFALLALARTRDPRYVETLRYKLRTAMHVETRLAAALGLGLHGSDMGYKLAMRALRVGPPPIADPLDPPEGQVLRIRQLAAAALGAIGRVDALPGLARMMDDPRDPRLQVSAAQAILQIIRVDQGKVHSFSTPGSGRK